MLNHPTLCFLCLLILIASCTTAETDTTTGNASVTAKPINHVDLPLTTPKEALSFTSGIRSILQDRKGNYWIGSHREGVARFDGKTFQTFTKDTGLMDNQVGSIQEDEQGNIWFGSPNGVSRYDGKTFTSYPTQLYLPKPERNAPPETLWFAAGKEAGVTWFDGKTVNYSPLPIPLPESPNKAYGVTGISKGKDGQVWIATYDALFHFDGESIRMVDERQFALKENEVLHIRSVLADSKGRIWVGNNGIGVLLIQGNHTLNFSAENGLIPANSPRTADHSPPGTLEHVFVIEEDSAGNIWFGDRDTGAWKFDGTTMTNYTIDKTLSTQMAWSIYNDNHNNLLFGMADGGLYKFEGDSFRKIL